jgi:hypothetical protein
MKRITIIFVLSFATLLPASVAANTPDTEQVVVTPNASALLPPSERAWTADDYEAASVILSHTPPDKLPASWPEPSAVFLRIVNPENLEPLRDMQEPMFQRMIDARRYLVATAKITACYLPDIKQNQEHREDVARLEGFFVQELGTLMALVQEIKTVPPPDFDKRAALAPYVDKIKQDLDKIVGDVAESLEAQQTRSEEARLRLASILASEYAHFSPFLTPKTRKIVEGILSEFPEPANGAPRNASAARGR